MTITRSKSHPVSGPGGSPRAILPRLLAALSIPGALLASACGHAAPEADLVVRDARIVTVVGDVASGAAVEIDDGRITRVAKAGDRREGREEVDAHDRLVMPGLIEAHAHLLGRRDLGAEPALEHFIADGLPSLLESYLARGVTTVVTIGDPWLGIREVRERVASGELLGPRLLATGPLLAAGGWGSAGKGRTHAPWCGRLAVIEVGTVGEAREEVRGLAEGGADMIGIAPGGSSGAGSMPLDVVEVIVEEAHALGVPALAHGDLDAARAGDVVAAGVDLLVVPHTVCEGGIEDLLEKLRERDVPVILTLGIPLQEPDAGGATDPLPGAELAEECVRELAAEGVALVMGSGSPPSHPGGGGSLRELGLLRAAGLFPSEVIDAATAAPGRRLAPLGDAGLIEPGRRADLLLVEGIPAEDLAALARLKVVLTGGRVVLDRRPR